MDEGVMDFVDSEGLVSRQDWLEAVKKVLGDSDFDQVLVSDLLGGIRVEPLYLSLIHISEPTRPY